MNGPLVRRFLAIVFFGLLAAVNVLTSSLVAQTSSLVAQTSDRPVEAGANQEAEATIAPGIDDLEPAPLVAPNESPTPTAPRAATPRVVQLTPADYAGGWRQAGTGADGLDSRIRRHVLYVTSDGRARGRISLINPVTHKLIPASDLKLTLLTPQGTPAFQAMVEPNGTFQLSGVPQGVFGVVASGPTAFMTFDVQTIRTDGLTPQTGWSFDGAAVPERDFPALKAILSLFDQQDLDIPTWIEPPEDQIPAAAVERGNWTPADGVNMDARATPLNHHRAFLHEDGRLLGRLRQLHPVTGRSIAADDLNVHIIKNGEILASTPTDSLGRFDFENIPPGVYSLIAEGDDGFLALGVDVVEKPAPDATQIREQDVAFFDDSPGIEIDAATVNRKSLPWVQQTFQQGATQTPPAAPPLAATPPIGPSVPGTTPAGGGGGGLSGGGGSVAGGGGFGGGASGGLLEALAIAGLAAGAFALADSNDSTIQPVSPSTP